MADLKPKPLTIRKEGEVQLKLSWAPAEDLPLVFVDQMALQVIEGKVYLTFGQMRVGVLDPEVINAVEIAPMARFVATKKGIEALHALLGRTLDKMKGQE